MRKNRCVIVACAVFVTTFALCMCHSQTPDSNINTESITSVTTNYTTTESEVTTSVETTVGTTATTNVTTEITTTTSEVSDEAQSVIETEMPVIETHEEQQTECIAEQEPIVVEEYLVYKPSTYYIHRSTCRWNGGDAYKVDSAEGLTARLCSECNPEANGFEQYVEPEPERAYMSDTDKYYLAVMLCHECSPLAGAEHNAHSVAAMVNRGGSIYSAISSSCCPWWPWGHGSWCMDNGCFDGMDTSYAYEAIDYYLSHVDSYSWVTGWCASGDGIHNSYH